MKRFISLFFAVVFVLMTFAGCTQSKSSSAGLAEIEDFTQATEVTEKETEKETEKTTEKETEPPTQKPTQKPTKKVETWKELYIDRINRYLLETDYPNEIEFSLVHIDGDSIPELVIGGPSHVFAASFFWVYNDRLNEKMMGYTISQGFTYIEYEGLIRINSIWQGSGGDTIYSLSQGNLSEIASGTCSTINQNFTWNGESVPQMDYDYMLNDVFPSAHAKDVVETIYTKDEIFDVIDNY